MLVPVLLLCGRVCLRAEITPEDLRQLQTRFQQAEESEERLRARIQRLEATIAELRSQIGEVRSVASSAGKDSVTQDQFRKVLEQLRDLDRRRQEDNEKVLQQLRKLADLPAPPPPSFDDPKPKGRRPGPGAEAEVGTGSGRVDARPDSGAPEPRVEAPKPSLPPEYEFYEHVVRDDQILGQIINEYNKGYGLKVRLKHVLEANPKLRPERLLPGQKIRIPVVK